MLLGHRPPGEGRGNRDEHGGHAANGRRRAPIRPGRATTAGEGERDDGSGVGVLETGVRVETHNDFLDLARIVLGVIGRKGVTREFLYV
jgi:hypothetical protein